MLSENPPWFDARGAAIGLLVGFGFPLGLQWISLGLIRLCFKFNVVLALALTWVNNPLTVAPMYYGYYLLGSILTGRVSNVNADAFAKLMAPLYEAGSFLESLDSLTQIGSDIMIKWAIGATITGVVSGILGYIFTYLIQVHRAGKRSAAGPK